MWRLAALLTAVLALAVVVVGCGSGKVVESPAPSHIPGTLDEGMFYSYRSANPAFSIDVPAFLEENPASAPDYLASDAAGASKAVFGAMEELKALEDDVYLYAVSQPWASSVDVTNESAALAAKLLAKSYKAEIKSQGGRAQSSTLETTRGLDGQMVVAYVPSSGLAYMTAVFGTAERAYMISYLCESVRDAELLTDVFRVSFLSFALE